MISKKNKILAILLSVLLFVGATFVGVTAAPKGVKFNGVLTSANGKTVKIKLKKYKGAKKYQIRYGYKKSLKGAKVKTFKKTTVTLKKLKVGKTLYYKVRAKLKKGYTKYTAVKKIKLTVAIPNPATKPVATAPTTTVPTPTRPISLKYTVFDIEDVKENIRLVGRCGYSDDGKNIICDWTTSGFEFNMLCRDDLTVKFSVNGLLGLIGVVIDDDYDNMLTYEFMPSDTKATFDTNLAYGVHKIRVIKLNECDAGTNSVIFKGFEIKGILQDAPQESSLKFEVYGDSITCGYGNLCPSRDLDNNRFGYFEDGAKTYISLVAQKAGADLNVVARSGMGLEKGIGSDTNIISTYWDKAHPRYDITDKWDFGAYTPDVVFINLGTNDTSMNNGTSTRESVKASALAFIGNIRAKYPNCKIVWLEGAMGAYFTEFSQGVNDAIAETDNAWYISGLPHGNNGGVWHPNVAEHKNIADYLYNQLVNKGII